MPQRKIEKNRQKKEEMRVVIMTSDYYIGALVALRTFLESPQLKKYNIKVVGIISASTFTFDKRSFRVMNKFIKRSGPAFVLKSTVTNVWQSILLRLAKWFIPYRYREYLNIDELAQIYNIPHKHVSSINSKEAIKFMKSKKPDYLVSSLLLQIVKKEVLDIPTQGSINFHPALTQTHRGSFSAFWTLLKNWTRSGATVHFMTEQLDDGKVILQKHFFVHPSDTINSINLKAAKLGGELLVKALVKLKKRKTKGFGLKKLGGLFTMPTKKEVKAFEKQKKKTIDTEDLFRL